MNVMQSPRRDEGTAYEIRPAKYKSELVEADRMPVAAQQLSLIHI